MLKCVCVFVWEWERVRDRERILLVIIYFPKRCLYTLQAIMLNESELPLTQYGTIPQVVRTHAHSTTGAVNTGLWLIYCLCIYSIVAIVILIYYNLMEMELYDMLCLTELANGMATVISIHILFAHSFRVDKLTYSIRYFFFVPRSPSLSLSFFLFTRNIGFQY